MVIDKDEVSAAFHRGTGHIDVDAVHTELADDLDLIKWECLAYQRAIPEGKLLAGIAGGEPADTPGAIGSHRELVGAVVGVQRRIAVMTDDRLHKAGQDHLTSRAAFHHFIFGIQRNFPTEGQGCTVIGVLPQDIVAEQIDFVAKDFHIMLEGLIGDQRLGHRQELGSQGVCPDHGGHGLAEEGFAVPGPGRIHIVGAGSGAGDALYQLLYPGILPVRGVDGVVDAGGLIAAEEESGSISLIHIQHGLTTHIIGLQLTGRVGLHIKVIGIHGIAERRCTLLVGIDIDHSFRITLCIQNPHIDVAAVVIGVAVVFRNGPACFLVIGNGEIGAFINRQLRFRFRGRLRFGFGFGFGFGFRLRFGFRLGSRFGRFSVYRLFDVITDGRFVLAAGGQRENHDQCQQKRNHSFHWVLLSYAGSGSKFASRSWIVIAVLLTHFAGRRFGHTAFHHGKIPIVVVIRNRFAIGFHIGPVGTPGTQVDLIPEIVLAVIELAVDHEHIAILGSIGVPQPVSVCQRQPQELAVFTDKAAHTTCFGCGNAHLCQGFVLGEVLIPDGQGTGAVLVQLERAHDRIYISAGQIRCYQVDVVSGSKFSVFFTAVCPIR